MAIRAFCVAFATVALLSSANDQNGDKQVPAVRSARTCHSVLKRMRFVEQNLQNSVASQSSAIEAVLGALDKQHGKAVDGQSIDKMAPVALLFAGPPDTGKSTAAVTIARALSDSPSLPITDINGIVRYDFARQVNVTASEVRQSLSVALRGCPKDGPIVLLENTHVLAGSTKPEGVARFKDMFAWLPSWIDPSSPHFTDEDCLARGHPASDCTFSTRRTLLIMTHDTKDKAAQAVLYQHEAMDQQDRAAVQSLQSSLSQAIIDDVDRAWEGVAPGMDKALGAVHGAMVPFLPVTFYSARRVASLHLRHVLGLPGPQQCPFTNGTVTCPVDRRRVPEDVALGVEGAGLAQALLTALDWPELSKQGALTMRLGPSLPSFLSSTLLTQYSMTNSHKRLPAVASLPEARPQDGCLWDNEMPPIATAVRAGGKAVMQTTHALITDGLLPTLTAAGGLRARLLSLARDELQWRTERTGWTPVDMAVTMHFKVACGRQSHSSNQNSSITSLDIVVSSTVSRWTNAQGLVDTTVLKLPHVTLLCGMHGPKVMPHHTMCDVMPQSGASTASAIGGFKTPEVHRMPAAHVAAAQAPSGTLGDVPDL